MTSSPNDSGTGNSRHAATPRRDGAAVAGPRSSSQGMGVFVVIWLGQVVSFVGSAMAAFALGVKIFQVTGSVSRFALASLAVALPILLVSPVAGRVADRYDRRKILILSHLGAGAVHLVLYALVSAGRVTSWHVYPLIALGSVFAAFVWPAMSATTTVLVGRAHLARASGMLQMGNAMAQVAGPLLGGLLLVAMGLPSLIVLNVVSYLLAAIALISVRFPTAGSASNEAPSATDAAPAVRAKTSGWFFIKERPGLLRLLILFAALNFVVGMVQVLITPLVLSFAGPTTLGLVLAIAASGMLVGSTLMAVWGGAKRRMPLILVTIALQGMVLVTASFRPSASLIAIAAFFFLLGVPLVTASSQALWQIKTPLAIQGRVFAIRRMIASASVPIAQAAAGPLIDHVFEPLAARGAFDRLLGPIVGIGSGAGDGAGRGIAVLMLGLGCFLLVAVAIGAASRALRHAETDVPDALVPGESEASTEALERPSSRREITFDRLSRRHGWLLATAFVGTAWMVLAAGRPPAPLPASAPEDSFSATRALTHIEAISTEPHPIGTAAQARVRAYLGAELAALGLEVEEQAATVSRTIGRTQVIGDVINVVARLPASERGTGTRQITRQDIQSNTEPRRSVLLIAHYDTVPTGTGAADNGAGVAALLETARALRAGPPLTNDVVFLFTDGEELALLGAHAFRHRHAWARDIAVALNVDARGSSGPSMMFRTGEGNGWWLPHFLAGTPYPRGNALLASLFDLLPNQTDFALFRAGGTPGFDFAFMDGLTHYHTALDRASTVSLRSVQHQGANLLALTRRLADLDLTAPAGERVRPDRAFFNLIGFRTVHYAPWISWGSMVIVLGLVIAVMWAGRRRFSVGGVALGFLAHLVLLLAIPILISLLWLGLRDLAPIPVIMGSTPAAHGFMAGFALLALAIGLAMMGFFRHQIKLLDLALAGVLWWLVLLTLTSGTALPVTTNFIAVWPLLTILPLLFMLIRQRAPMRPVALGSALFLASLPALLLLVPLIQDVYVGAQTTAQLGGVALIPGVFLLMLLVVPLEAMMRTLPRAAPLISAGVGLVLVTGAVTSSIRSRPRPELSSAVYTLDTETGRAVWFSFDPGPNRWNRQFGFQTGETASFAHFYPLVAHPLPSAPANAVLASTAPTSTAQTDTVRPVSIRLLSREPAAHGWQTLRLSLDAREQTYGRILHFTPSDAVRSIHLAGLRITLHPPVQLVVRVPVPATEILTLEVEAATDVVMTVVDQQPSFPPLLDLLPRGSGDLPRPFLTVLRTDATLVRSVFELPARAAPMTEPFMLVPRTEPAAVRAQEAPSISASTAAAVSSSSSASN